MTISRTTQNVVEKYDGELAAGDDVSVDMSDAVVIVRDGELQTLGAGRHAFDAGGGEVYFVNVLRKRWRGDFTPTFTDDEGGELTLAVGFDYAVKVSDASRFVENLGDIESDDALKEWVGSQLLDVIANLAAARPDIAAGALAEATLEAVRGPFDELGLEVSELEDVTFTVEE